MQQIIGHFPMDYSLNYQSEDIKHMVCLFIFNGFLKDAVEKQGKVKIEDNI